MRSFMDGASRPLTYILDEHGIPQPCDDPLEWATWRESCDFEATMRIGEDTVGDLWISTVFMGHDLAAEGPPVLYETAVRRGGEWTVLDRYTCQADAVVGHVYAVQQARQNAHRFWEED